MTKYRNSNSPHEASKSFSEKTRSLLDVASEDYKKASRWQRLGLMATAACLAYEWGPGNETVTPLITSQFMSRTEGVEGAVVTGLVAGGFTAAQQIGTGYLMAESVKTFDGLAQKSFEHAKIDENGDAIRKPFNELPAAVKMNYAVFLGSSFVVAREAALTGNIDRPHLHKQVHSSALRAAGAVSVVAAGAAGGFEAMENVANDTVFENPTEWLVKGVESPITWVAVGIGSIALSRLYSKWSRPHRNTPASER